MWILFGTAHFEMTMKPVWRASLLLFLIGKTKDSAQPAASAATSDKSFFFFFQIVSLPLVLWTRFSSLSMLHCGT